MGELPPAHSAGPLPSAFWRCCLPREGKEVAASSLLSSSKEHEKTAVYVKMLATTPTMLLFS